MLGVSRHAVGGRRRAGAQRADIHRAVARQDAEGVLRLHARQHAVGAGWVARGAGLRGYRRLPARAKRHCRRQREIHAGDADGARARLRRRGVRRRDGEHRFDAGEDRRALRQARTADDVEAHASRARCGRRRDDELDDVQQGLSRGTVLVARSHQHRQRRQAAAGVHVPAGRDRHVFDGTGRLRRHPVRDDAPWDLRDRCDDVQAALGASARRAGTGDERDQQGHCDRRWKSHPRHAGRFPVRARCEDG